MKLGCSGIVLKQTAPELIVKSIRKVHGGEIWLDSNTTAAVMRQFAVPGEIGGSGAGKSRERSPLSQREREIVQLVAQGYKNKEMAEKMFISEQTVKNHLHNIFDKLGVSDRLGTGLVCHPQRLARERGALRVGVALTTPKGIPGALTTPFSLFDLSLLSHCDGSPPGLNS